MVGTILRWGGIVKSPLLAGGWYQSGWGGIIEIPLLLLLLNIGTHLRWSRIIKTPLLR
jgi:hypothetical protein